MTRENHFGRRAGMEVCTHTCAVVNRAYQVETVVNRAYQVEAVVNRAYRMEPVE